MRLSRVPVKTCIEGALAHIQNDKLGDFRVLPLFQAFMFTF